MKIKPLQDGSRSVDIDTPYLLLRATIRDGGIVEVHECDIREPRPSRGLGDTVAKATSAVGIKPCGGCNKRKEILNRAFPYSKDIKR